MTDADDLLLFIIIPDDAESFLHSQEQAKSMLFKQKENIFPLSAKPLKLVD